MTAIKKYSSKPAPLAKYEAAWHALQQAASVDEVKDIRDKALALEAYAHQAKDTKLLAWATEIKIRAERKAGEMLKEMEKNTGAKGIGKSVVTTENHTPTLADIGVSKKQSSNWQKIANIPEDVFEEAITEAKDNAATLSTSQMVKKVKTKERKERNEQLKASAPTLIDGKYDVVVIDPPWPMQKIERELRPNQVKEIDYPTMTIDELKAFIIPSSNNCHVFLWTTHKFLPDAFILLETWGYKYVCTFVWHKPGGFQPFGLPQYNCEFVLYARKGSPRFAETKNLFTCFNAPRGKHSEKPEEFYELLNRVTIGRKIDIFARKERNGFDNYGNEVPARQVAGR